ncbi:MAG: hypothetical protein IJ868_00050, partial [Prevotella sp.]|nr:hypothetical protein [Prevotella sp.]
MKKEILIVSRKRVAAILLLLGGCMAIHAQEEIPEATVLSEEAPADSAFADSIGKEVESALSAQPLPKKVHTDWSTWRPNPQRALWLAL